MPSLVSAFVRSQIGLINPLLKSLNLEQYRKLQDSIATVGKRPLSFFVHYKPVSFPCFDAAWAIPLKGRVNRAALYLHGGAYTAGTLPYAKRYGGEIAKLTGRATLCVGYRLAPEHPFPAALAAATSLIPIPGIDLATDLALMARLINRINEHFGLSEEQIGRLSSQRQAIVYRLLAGAGGTLAARLTTPALVGRIVRIVGLRLTTMEAARLVPIAGQVIAAGIGYWSVNTVAMRHIAHCERIVGELQGDTAER